MQSAQLDVKSNYVIAEGELNTAPLPYVTLTGTISSTTNAKIFSTTGFTSAEKANIRQDDTFLVEENGQLMVVASFDSFNNTIIFQNAYTGDDFAAAAAQWTKGPRQPGYPRNWSVKGPLYKLDTITHSSVMAYPYDRQKKRVVVIEALSGEVTVSDAIQSPDGGTGGGGTGVLVNAFVPETVVTGGEGDGYIQDARMANKAHPPYFYEITVDDVPINLYSATPSDNELEYNADATLGRFDAINSFEIVPDTTFFVKIYLIS